MSYEYEGKGTNVGEKVFYFVMGGIVGATVALLFAPKSGVETRELIAKKAKETKDTSSEKIKELQEKLKEAKEKISEQATELSKRGKELLDKKKEVLSSAIEAGKKAYKSEKEGKKEKKEEE